MQAHDPLILFAPRLLHFLELGLANHILDTGGEMARHAADAPDPITDRAHDLRQVLRTDEDEREDRDDRELGRIDAEHGRLGLLAGLVVPRRRRRSYRIGRTRCHVDRVLWPDVVAETRRLLPALLFVAVPLVVVLVGHALLEAFEALRNVAHHGRE